MATQYVITCPDHPECSAICCEDEGEVVWVSHAPADVPPEVRIAIGSEVEDYRA